MLLLLRKLKHNHFMNKKTRKYLFYAVGEVLLLIVGILIALQIDNWNSERQQESLLRSYLQSISNNMGDDASELAQLRAARLDRSHDGIRSFMLTGRIDYSFDIAEIFFFNKLIVEASQNLYFKSDTSGYEALKSSGVMNRLQGRDIERVLSKYYDQVSRVEDFEQRLGDLMSSLNLQLLLSYPSDIPQWHFWAPRALPPDMLQALQPEFARLINSPVVREIINLQLQASGLVREYDRLRQLSDAFSRMVESNSMAFDEPGDALILNSDSGAAPEQYAEIIVDGQVSSQFYAASGVADGFEPVFDFRFVTRADDSLRISYPGSDSWAAVFLQVLGADEDRAVLDFSQFDTILLEVKADSGSESLVVHIKDRFMPDSEPPDIVELQLTDDWQTYEIELSRFERTDLQNLITPLGFSFLREPQSFFIRNVRFVNADRSE